MVCSQILPAKDWSIQSHDPAKKPPQTRSQSSSTTHQNQKTYAKGGKSLKAILVDSTPPSPPLASKASTSLSFPSLWRVRLLPKSLLSKWKCSLKPTTWNFTPLPFKACSKSTCQLKRLCPSLHMIIGPPLGNYGWSRTTASILIWFMQIRIQKRCTFSTSTAPGTTRASIMTVLVLIKHSRRPAGMTNSTPNLSERHTKNHRRLPASITHICCL